MSRERLTSRIAAESDKRKKKENRDGNQRNLEGFEYDSSKATVLKKALHNVNVSLGTLLSAMKDLSLLRGSEITPDGMLGGRGFIMPFKEIKMKINTAVNDLSDITDTIADELTNPKWGLSPDEKKRVKREKEEIDDRVEEIEDTVPSDKDSETPSDGVPTEELPPAEDADQHDTLGEINPKDVVNSAEVESLKRYRDFIDGNVKDKVASVISKSIVANLTKGV